MGGARIGAGRKPQEAKAPAPRAGVPTPPPWLSRPARKLYKFYAAQLGDRMTPGDRDAVAHYATVLASVADVEAAIRQPGFERVVSTGKGGLAVHPLIAEHRKLLALAKVWATALGLTPTSRSRAKPAQAQEGKPDWRAVVYQMPTT